MKDAWDSAVAAEARRHSKLMTGSCAIRRECAVEGDE